MWGTLHCAASAGPPIRPQDPVQIPTLTLWSSEFLQNFMRRNRLCSSLQEPNKRVGPGKGLYLHLKIKTTVRNSHTDFSKPKFVVSYSIILPPHIHSHLPSRQRVIIRCFIPRSTLFSLKILFSENRMQTAMQIQSRRSLEGKG